MNDHSELYRVLEQWISDTYKGRFERFEKDRTTFHKLEEAIFGPLNMRTKNPLALQYDRTALKVQAENQRRPRL